MRSGAEDGGARDPLVARWEHASRFVRGALDRLDTHARCTVSFREGNGLRRSPATQQEVGLKAGAVGSALNVEDSHELEIVTEQEVQHLGREGLIVI